MSSRRVHARLRAVVAALGVAPIVALSVAAAPVTAGATGLTRDIARAGTVSFTAAPTGAVGGTAATELAGQGGAAAVVSHERSRAGAAPEVPTGDEGGGGGRDRAPALLASFDGLDQFQQRTANGGRQFTTEPPDQGLCVGNGFVLESVNDAMTVYDENGSSLKGVVDLNTFYGYPPAIDRSARPPVRGPFVTVPSCLYDQATQRWFHLVLTLDTFPDNGAFSGTDHLDLAVSTTSSPLGSWNVFHVDVTDDGTNGTPNHGCATGAADPRVVHPNACFGDFPHLGADRNGIFITTNEYSLFGHEFHSANLYAFSKRALTSGAATVRVTQMDTVGAVKVGDTREAGFTLWPSVVPDQRFDDRAHGTELFLSSDAGSEVSATLRSNRLVTWALTNTRSLDGTPDLRLVNTVNTVRPYAKPAPSEQKAGSIPLGDCINDTTLPAPGGTGCWRRLFEAEPAHQEVEGVLDSGDTRMMQTQFAHGLLWGALDTALMVEGRPQAAIEFFAVRTEVERGGVEARVVSNGYVSLPGNNVTFPAIGMTASGRGVMGFTVVGRDHFPGSGYAAIDAEGVGRVRIAAEGEGPQDGFPGYKAFFGRPQHWGDYAAAAVSGSDVWIANEYIGQTCDLATFANPAAFGTCGGTRVALANWATEISHLRV